MKNLNKVLVSSLVLVTMIGSTLPAFAAELPQTAMTDYARQMAQEEGMDVSMAISSIKNTVNNIQIYEYFSVPPTPQFFIDGQLVHETAR